MLIYLNKLHRENGHLQDVLGRTRVISLLDKFRTGYEDNYYPHITAGLEIGHTGGLLSFPLWKSIEFSMRDTHPIFTERLFVESQTHADALVPVSAKQRTSNDVYSVLFYKNIQRAIGDLTTWDTGVVTDPRLIALEELSTCNTETDRKGRLIQSQSLALLSQIKRNPHAGSVGYESGGVEGITSEIDFMLDGHPNDSSLVTSSIFPSVHDVPLRPLIEQDKTLNIFDMLGKTDTAIRLDTSVPTPLELWDVPPNRRTAPFDDYIASFCNMLKATDLVARCTIRNRDLDVSTLKFESYIDRYMGLFKNRLFLEDDLTVCRSLMQRWIQHEKIRATSVDSDPEVMSLLDEGCDIVMTKTFSDEVKISLEISECDSADVFERSVYGTYFDLASARLCSPSVGFSPSILPPRVLGS